MDNFVFLDKFYRSDDIGGGQRFKAFFREFAQAVFAENMRIWQNFAGPLQDCYFPLAYKESTATATMFAALKELGFGYMAEFGVDCGEYKRVENTQARYIDFVAWRGDLAVAVECKSFCVNAKNERLLGSTPTLITDAIEQIKDLKKMKKHFGGALKVALFAVPICCAQGDEADDEVLMRLYKEVSDACQGMGSGGALCGALDLRGDEDSNFWGGNDRAAFMALVACVAE